MTMPTKVAMAFVAAVIALAFPALAAGNFNREKQHNYESAQYCIPQLDAAKLPGRDTDSTAERNAKK